MAYIDNSETKRELDEAIRGNANTNLSPTSLANQVVPVININPKANRRANIVRNINLTASGAGTIYTIPSDKDFFLCSIGVGLVKDVACDVATGRVVVVAVIDGATVQILGIPTITLTAQQSDVAINFSTPIKLDRGTQISITGTYAAGVMSRNAYVSGFTVEA